MPNRVFTPFMSSRLSSIEQQWQPSFVRGLHLPKAAKGPPTKSCSIGVIRNELGTTLYRPCIVLIGEDAVTRFSDAMDYYQAAISLSVDDRDWTGQTDDRLPL